MHPCGRLHLWLQVASVADVMQVRRKRVGMAVVMWCWHGCGDVVFAWLW